MESQFSRRKTYSAEEIKRLAAGREVEILEHVAGIASELLDGKKEHPCPKCGGNTRFRLIDASSGAVLCSHCFNENNGDFIAAVQWRKDVAFSEALSLIGEYLHVTPQSPNRPLAGTPRKLPIRSPWTSDATANRDAIESWCKDHKRGTGVGGVLWCMGTTGVYNQKPSLALPMYGADLETETGRSVYHLDGTEIDGKKVLNATGSKSGIIGTIESLRNLTELETVYKVEGPSDAIALASAIPEAKRKTVAVFANGCGAAENPDKTPYRELIEGIAAAGCEFVLIADNDEAGQAGLAKWGTFAAQKGCKTWTVSLPETVFDTPVNDVRDYFLAGGTFAELDTLAKPFSRASLTPGESAISETKIPTALEWEPFPVDALPSSLSGFIIESAEALVVDPAYLGPFCLAAVASAIGSAVWIQPKIGWKEPCILWPTIVAPSGSGKSPALDTAIEPLWELQKEADKQYREELAEFEIEQTSYSADFAIWKSNRKRDALSDPPGKPEEPIAKAYIADDTTPEALIEVLEQNPFGVCMPKDELSGWLGGFDAYGNGKGAKDLPFWLRMHGSRYHRSNRKTGKKLAVVSTPAVSVCGGIQPGVLKKILTENEHYFDAGLAGRMLFSMPPDRSQRWTKAFVSAPTKNGYRNLIRSILSMRTGENALDPENPCVVTLSKQAETLYAAFQNENADERDKMESETQKAFWPKITAYAARIALVLHVVRWVESKTADFEKVDGESMESAIRLMRWFKRESLRIIEKVRGEVAQVDFEANSIMEAIRRNGGAITVRELQQARSMYRNSGGADLAEKKLREMVSAGKLEAVWEQGDRGRGKEIFRIISNGNGNTIPVFPGKNIDCVTVTTSSYSKIEMDCSGWTPPIVTAPESRPGRKVIEL